MGLAASQARFLGLTARKSNVEYQGQQINQARTALSNEVMSLYEKYNRLNVPVPPSVNDYTKTVYKIDSTAENYEIYSFAKITEGQYKDYYNVVLSYNEEVPKAYTYTANSLITVDENYDNVSFVIGADSYYYKKDDENSTITKITEDYSKYPGLETIMEQYGLQDGVFYMFYKNSTAYYALESDLRSAVDEEGKYSGNFGYDYQGTISQEKKINAIAAITQESSGRLSAITVVECEDDPDLINVPHSITTSSEDDERAYEDAMNQYYYDKAKYENEVEKINKKTEKLQTQDKALELKLNQLDTEQNAIKTEMESISKVIEDTIKTVFKTYSS